MVLLSYLLHLAGTIYLILILVQGIVIWAKVEANNPVLKFISSTTEPILSKVRPLFPKATFDVSPIVVIVGLYIVLFVLFQLLAFGTPQPIYYAY